MIGEWKRNEQCKVEEYFVDGKMVAWLQKRPHYCDRGHWQVNAYTLSFPTLDAADGFPRYYMSYDVAKSETEAWVEWRLAKEGMNPETLLAYAQIFEKQRRWEKGGTLFPPSAIDLAAARALRWYAKCIIMANSGIGDPVEELKQGPATHVCMAPD